MWVCYFFSPFFSCDVNRGFVEKATVDMGRLEACIVMYVCMGTKKREGREVGEKEDERNVTEIQCVPMNLNGRARRARCIGLTSFLFFSLSSTPSPGECVLTLVSQLTNEAD